MKTTMTKEKALLLLEELLEIEEKNNIGYLTSYDRAVFQNIVREAFEEKEAEEISVNTPEGKLHATISSNSYESGICIELHPTGTDTIIDIALVRYDERTKEINIFNWDDATKDNYTSSATLTGLEEQRESEKDYE